MKLARSLSLFLLFSISTACSSNPKPQVAPEEKPPEPVFLKIYPPNSLAGINGATIWIDYRIYPHPDNRSYMVRWGDEGGEWGGTGRSLEGENEPYVFPRVWVERLYEGQYEVRLTLTRVENGREKEYRALAKFSVH